MRLPARIAIVMVAIAGWAPPATAIWQTFTSAHGLARGQVLAIAEDRLENLWFGTRSGVSRYDGLTWTTFTTADGLPSDVVRAILCDRSGSLWFATDAGVCRFDGSAWTTFSHPNGPANSDVYSILEDRSGHLWFGTDGGVSRYDGENWTTLTAADGLASNRVRGMVQDRRGVYWFATFGSGVSRLESTYWWTLGVADGLASSFVVSVLEDRHGRLWFGTLGSGVSSFDGVTWRTFTPTDGLAGNHVVCMLEDRSGDLWFGGDGGGLTRFDGTSWRNYGDEGGVGLVQAIAEDRSGNLWLGVGGALRHDRSGWRSFTASDGLALDIVPAMLEDRSGHLWFGTPRGLSRFDGRAWRTFTTADGLCHNRVASLMEDGFGRLWVGTRGGGVCRYDGATWTAVSVPGGLPSDVVVSMLADRAGRLWLGTLGGLTRCDANLDSCTTFTTADGLAGLSVAALLEDRFGHVWAACDTGGVSEYDGERWRSYRSADGLDGNAVVSLLEDRAGDLWLGAYWYGQGGGISTPLNRFDRTSWRSYSAAEDIHELVLTSVEDRWGALWFGTFGFGVTRFDGSTWRVFTSVEGLVQDEVFSSLEDRAGNLWFGTQGGVSRYEPDRVPPNTVFASSPPRLSPSRDHRAVFAAAFNEIESIEFSYRFDGSPWTDWSRETNWVRSDLPDGTHVLEVRARDFSNNADSIPAVARFEIDGTPPAPVVSFPAFGQALRGVVEVRGTAADARFAEYRVEVRATGSTSWDPPQALLLHRDPRPVVASSLATWDTSLLPDGTYDLRLSVTDTVGLTGIAQVTVIVDNHPPYADVTAPARVVAATGGDIYTTNAELHVYFPPRAFREDAVVTVRALASDSVPGTQPGGAVRVLAGYEVGWGEAVLEKGARLELSYAGVEPTPEAGSLAIHHSADGAIWRRLGGTVEADARRIGLVVSEPGWYALYAGSAGGAGERGLSALSFTPRVFSPTGGFADREVGIGFVLGEASSVTVRVYSRAGWLVREVVSGMSLGAGSQLVRWDGRDREGAVVADGLYLVTVEALGETKSQTLAVVR